MGKCVKKECFNCKTTTYFFVNKYNYKCTKCGHTFLHDAIDDKKTTGYDYKIKMQNKNRI